MVSKGFFFEHLISAIFARIVFRVLLAMSGTSACLNILALVAPGSFGEFLFKEFKSRFKTDFLDLRSARIFLFLKGFFQKPVYCNDMMLILFAKTSGLVEFATSSIIIPFSASVRSLWPPMVTVN